MADKKISALTSATTPLAGTEVLPIVQSGATVKVAVSDLTAARAVSMKSATVVGVADSLSESVRTNSFSGSVNGNSGIRMAAQCSDTKYNWLVGAQYNINQGFEITASTAVGGGTFSTPILSTVAPSGDVTVGTGNIVIGTSGKGIDFSATSHPAGMTSELLSDYEEGTWTPTFTSTDATFSYTSNYGAYTKNGRQVTATFRLLASASGTVTNLVYISSLPFTSGSTPNVAYGGYVTFSTTLLTPVILLGPSETSAQLTIPITAADATPTVLGMNGVNKWLQGVIIYFV